MVVLGAGQQQRLGLVVEELGAAVEVGGVVLVPLDDEAVAGAVVEARRQVLGRAADQVAGIAAAGGVDPGRHRRRRRLAVGAGHHQGAVVVEEEAGERLRHRDDGQAEALGGDRLGVVAVDGVADDDQVRPRLAGGAGS